MAENVRRRGYFSIVRWRSNPTRDEAKNIGIVLIDPEGEIGGFRRLPPSRLSPRLHEQGLIDDVLEGFSDYFGGEKPPDLKQFEDLREGYVNSLVFTEPKKVLVKDKDKTLDALYRAFVQKRAGYSKGRKITKGVLRNDVATTLRKKGYGVGVGRYIQNFIFDVVIEDPTRKKTTVAELLSFANDKKDWTDDEHDAGHFLYALGHVKLPSLAIVQPPTEISLDTAYKSHDRVMGWFSNENVEVIEPEDIANGRFPARLTGSKT